MRYIITEAILEYFGARYMDRDLPRGVYQTGEKFKAVVFDEAGRHVHSHTCSDAHKAVRKLKAMRDDHHWYGVAHDPLNNFGFIYKITELNTDRIYFGRKQYRFWDGPRGGYKCTDLKDTEWFIEDLWRESDWRYYKSSAPILTQKIIDNPSNYLLENVSMHTDKLSLWLAEIKIQVEHDVLHAEGEDGEYKYYNANIGSCLFRPPISHSRMREIVERAMHDAKKYATMPGRCRKCGSIIPFGHQQCCP